MKSIQHIRSLTAAVAAATVMALSACALTRPEVPQAAAPPAEFKEAAGWQHAAEVASVPDDWWTLFKDPVLDDLQRRLVVGNENLKALTAQVAAARAILDASRSAMLPTLSAGLSASRDRNGASSVNGVARGPSNTVSLTASSSWEIDLWGRLQQASEGAQSALQASADDLASARLSAQATLAQTYFTMRTSEAQQALLARSLQGYQRTLDLTQARYDGGIAARTDVLQAQTQLKTVEAQVAESAGQRALSEHAIAALLGIPPSTLTVPRTDTLPATIVPPEVVPSTLVQRRPDIAAAQRRVAAAYAQIGVADAAFFPALVLSADGGYQHSSLANLISAPNLVWSIGASVSQAIFDGGQRRLASAQARASADQATSAYRQTVITAFQEVEDNLALAAQLQQEADRQSEALDYANRTLEITLEQYRAGTVSYLNVVTSQNAALSSQINLLLARNRQLAAVNILLKNIAGRWDPVVGAQASNR